MNVIKRDGSREPVDIAKIQKATAWACEGLNVSQSELEVETQLLMFDGIQTSSIQDALIQTAGTLISSDPDHQDYKFVAARLLLLKLYKEVAGSIEYPHIRDYLTQGVLEGRLDVSLLKFDLDRINAAIDPKRDLLFDYLGLQTLTDRYFIRSVSHDRKKEGNIIELPQHFWMRVAMGLALNENEKHPTDAAIQFYGVLSELEYISSTPTLFNSGTLRPQMSSCYLNTVADQIDRDEGENRFASIFGTIQECANLSKFAGGIGTSWTRVRSAGDLILGTNGKSSGIVPYLKIYNDTAVAVNQGGKRNGSFAPYLEPWHPDAMDFMELKENTGEERRRTHDIYPAWWLPDLFMERVEENGVWSFFSPAQYPELHELYGDEFKARYEELEAQGKFVEQTSASDMWRKMVVSILETGHPWITFKDECNRRNPQSHVGVIHSSNLCTEITLNTSDDETAVCNLGSVNLSRVKTYEDIRRVVRVAMRMLDNVIDVNFYPSDRARASNLKHRPVGLGVMGEAEYMASMGIKWDSIEHVQECDRLFEIISYYAIEASSNLALERGAYPSFEGSKWSKGILPIDTARDKAHNLNWSGLREKVMRFGMRNSNTMAIAPTATISNIAGTTPCIEPALELEYTKSNLSGDFIVFDPCLKYMKREDLKEAFEIDPHWFVMCAAARQKWIDQAQSLNIYIKAGTKGRAVSDVYFKAWKLGLKTTYYCRTQSTQVKTEAAPEVEAEVEPEVSGSFCTMEDMRAGTCESCQ